MIKLNEIGIPTHYIKKLNMREQLVRKVEIIPVEFVVRNIAAGSIVKRLGLKEGSVFSRPLIEHYLKKDELGDPLINEDHIINFEWGTRDELDEMQEYGLRINDFLRGLFFGIGLKLVDFKIELPSSEKYFPNSTLKSTSLRPTPKNRPLKKSLILRPYSCISSNSSRVPH